MIKKNYERANQKLFHLTEARLVDTSGLPDYKDPIRELREAFTECYKRMGSAERCIPEGPRQGMGRIEDCFDFAVKKNPKSGNRGNQEVC